MFLYAFDLIELNGDDLRRDPLQLRKATLVSTLARAGPGIRFNEHMNATTELPSSATLARWASKASCQAQGPAYRSGRSSDWLKMTNPACAAVKREAEEDWGTLQVAEMAALLTAADLAYSRELSTIEVI